MVKQLQLNPVTSVLEEIVGPLWTTVHCCVGRALRNSKHGCCPQRCEIHPQHLSTVVYVLLDITCKCDDKTLKRNPVWKDELPKFQTQEI